jgi:hypothetical protein
VVSYKRQKAKLPTGKGSRRPVRLSLEALEARDLLSTIVTEVNSSGTQYLTILEPNGGPDGLGAIVRINPVNGGTQLVSDNAICGNQVFNHPTDIITEVNSSGTQYLTFLDPTGGPDGQGSIVRINESSGGSQLVSDNAICGSGLFNHPSALTLETINRIGYLTMMDPTGGPYGTGSIVRINPTNGGSQLVSYYLPPAGYVLQGGNLYKPTTAGLILLDTGVQEFAVAGGRLYDLHYNGTVWQQQGSGASWQQIRSNVSSLVSDASGNLFALDYNTHQVYEHVPGTLGSWNVVTGGGSQIGSLVGDATGNLFALDYGTHTVYEHALGTGNNWNAVTTSGFRDLVGDASGNVFALSNNNDSVWEHALGAGAAWSQVTSTGFSDLVGDATGNVFALGYGNGTVWEHVLGSGWAWNVVTSTGFSDLVSDATGNVFALGYGNGTVWEHTPGSGWAWNVVTSTGFSNLVSDATGNVFALGYGNGTVWEHVLGAGWSWNPVTTSGFSNLVGDASGNVFALSNNNGSVWEHALGAGAAWNQVTSTGFSDLVSDASGNIFALGYGNGTVWEHVLGAGWAWNQVTSAGFSNLVSDATGNVFALGYGNGTVWEHVLGSGWAWNVVTSTGFSDLVGDATGNVFALGYGNGTVWEHVLGAGWSWNVVGPGTALISDAGGHIFALRSDHHAWEYDGNQSWHTASNFVILPTFDTSITNDPHAAAIEGKINQAVLTYEAMFTNPITVHIQFQEMSTGLGQNKSWLYQVPYTTYRSLLQADATTSNETTALAHLPTGPNNPVNGNANIRLTRANYLALGGNPGPSPNGYDGTISINTGITDAAGPSSTAYSLLAVTEHEIDEVLGFGSALNGLSNGAPAPTGAVLPEDLYRFDQNGNRSFTTALNAQAFFSFDGGTTRLAQFNQTQGGDFSDWYSTGAHTPQVQDAFATPGAQPQLGVELTVLDVLGYHPNPSWSF